MPRGVVRLATEVGLVRASEIDTQGLDGTVATSIRIMACLATEDLVMVTEDIVTTITMDTIITDTIIPTTITTMGITVTPTMVTATVTPTMATVDTVTVGMDLDLALDSPISALA